jgi:hypothetical protein
VPEHDKQPPAGASEDGHKYDEDFTAKQFHTPILRRRAEYRQMPHCAVGRPYRSGERASRFPSSSFQQLSQAIL